ncbi:MAG: TonB-dependent siderophore receptor [Burkholderiaceae bacterium]|nr:TonB-dependent siderophore receptor [Burkholderiaceae bacterium]
MSKRTALPASSVRTRPTPIAVAAHLALAGALLGGAAHAADVTTLQEIQVSGAADQGYAKKSTSTATKTDTLLRDTPQSITVVTQELIQDQAIQSMADVIRYVPGVVTAQGEGNRDTAVFRGNSSTGDFFIDGIRDDVQYYRDFYNIDSVEALKGSNAMIFGRGGSGGVINRVSKQPTWSQIREASLTLGSWNNRRVTADVGQAIDGNMAFRVTGMVEDSDSYRDGVKVERNGINPTLAIRAGARTSVVLGYEHFKDDRVADRGIPSLKGSNRPFSTDASTFFGNPDQSATWARVDAFNATVDHDLGNGFALRNRTRYADYDKFYQNIYAGSAVDPVTNRFTLGAYNNATQRTNLFNQTDLTFTVNTGAIKHKLATGLELSRQVTDNYRNSATFAGTSASTSASNPTVGTMPTFAHAASDANNHGVATAASIYLQDQIEFTPQWQAIAGLRYDRFNVDFHNNNNNSNIEVTDNLVSPRVGLVYKPVEAVSLYGSYSIAFVPRAGDQLGSLTAKNASFDPEKFTNLELGAKWDVTPDLAATAAIYRLNRTNVVITDPADTTKSILTDGQVSKGVELGLTGKIGRDWSVMGGYAYQNAKLTATASATALNGSTVAQVPTHTFSLWNRYDVTPVWAAALGVVHRDSIYASSANTVKLPSFTRFDGALFYSVNKNTKVQVNVENLFDKEYYASANSDNNITPGSPRALRVTLNAKF